jgi:hypothetical protein
MLSIAPELFASAEEGMRLVGWRVGESRTRRRLDTPTTMASVAVSTPTTAHKPPRAPTAASAEAATSTAVGTSVSP